MELMLNYLLMGMAGSSDGPKKIILHITLSSDHHKKNKKEGKNSTKRETKLIVLGEGGGKGRERIGSMRE